LHPKNHKNPEGKRKVIIIVVIIRTLIRKHSQKYKTPMLGENINERKNILAWYVRRTTTLNNALALRRFINTLNEGKLLSNQ